jgi:NAD(P)H-dependent FMN reductase
MLKIAIIAGSNRPNALNPQVVDWVAEQLAQRGDVEAEIVRFDDFNLPVLDEPVPAGAHMYQNDHTKAWGAKLAEFDGYIFVTPEYNHSVPGNLKNALDYVATEFNHKVGAIVNYGADKGVRAAEHLRLILINSKMATVRDQTSFSLFTDFADGKFAPQEVSSQSFTPMVDDLVLWGEALQGVRERIAEKAAANA